MEQEFNMYWLQKEVDLNKGYLSRWVQKNLQRDLGILEDQ
jgi:hypothetical protein